MAVREWPLLFHGDGMLDFFNLQTSQNGVNYQEFYGGGTSKDWIKPRGAGMVCFLLIGAGAGGRTGTINGSGGFGGGSGAVTRWIGPAIFIPDVLRINIGAGGETDSPGTATTLVYQQKNTTGYTLLTASGANSDQGGPSMSNNYFGAAGIFFSQGGTLGGTGSGVSTAANSFLAGGGGGGGVSDPNGGNSVPLYGYTIVSGSGTGVAGKNGYFINEPVLLGAGGSGGGGSVGAGAGGVGGQGGLGCGGGGGGATTSAAAAGGKGGDGAAFVWAW